jgi:protease-4
MANLSTYLKNLFLIFLLIQLAPVFVKTIKDSYTRALETRTRVGYLEIKDIFTDSSYYAKQLADFFKEDSIKAIMLKIESRGSTAGSAQALFNEIQELRKEYPKKTVTLVENICTSGGYYIACATDHIVVTPSSWIGSIGSAIPFQFKVHEFLAQYHVTYHQTSSGAYKTAVDPFIPITPEQAAMLQNVSDDAYQQFAQDVAKTRKLSMNDLKQWGDGKIFTGRQAKQVGLVDEIGSRSNAIAWLKENAPIEGKIEWVKPPMPSAFERIMGSPGAAEQEQVSFATEFAQALCTRLEQRLFGQTT